MGNPNRTQSFVYMYVYIIYKDSSWEGREVWDKLGK